MEKIDHQKMKEELKKEKKNEKVKRDKYTTSSYLEDYFFR
jgi:hypothetical protein